MSRVNGFLKLTCLCLLFSGGVYADICFAHSAPDLSAADGRNNVILIILDALRPDHVNCYGYHKETSPHIDELAARGVLFKNAFSQSSLTLPSTLSIFSSLYPFSHGVQYMYKDVIPDTITTLAQVLEQNGYKTSWFGDTIDPHTGGARGMLKGFQEKFDMYSKNLEQVCSWIRENRERPFFATIHSYNVHEQLFPFFRAENAFTASVPKDFTDILDGVKKKRWDRIRDLFLNNRAFLIEKMGEQWVEENARYFLQPFSVQLYDSMVGRQDLMTQKLKRDELSKAALYSVLNSLNEPEVKHLLMLLDGALFDVDRGIGRLVLELKRSGIYDKTLIIITADHGNEFKEHGKVGHGATVYDEAIHVPLIFSFPGWDKKIETEELAQSIDIAPTLLDILRIPVPEQMQGKSLAGIMKRKKGALSNEYVFSQSPAGAVSVRSKEWKFICNFLEVESFGARADGIIQGELYDLTKDKSERCNIIADCGERAQSLMNILAKKIKSVPLYSEGIRMFPPELDEDIRERIKKTGYW
jgi:arylsulfatase A-like enzyme